MARPSLTFRLLSLLATSSALTARPVAQVPGTWFENLAIRLNGNILLTTCYSPSAGLRELSAPGLNSSQLRSHPAPQSVNCLLGITETTPDVFVLAASNVSFSTGGERGAAALFAINFNHGLDPQPALVASLPDAVLLNGAASVPENLHVVLVADSILGQAWRVDTRTGDVGVGVRVPEMGADQNDGPATGINGLKIRGGYLWWTNSATTTLYKIRLTPEGRAACGAEVERVAVLSASVADDFVFGPGDGNVAWVATNRDGRVFSVGPDGNGEPVVDDALVAGASALEFGRTERDAKTLYVTTVAGNVVAVDTASGS
ncbi:hypothetical protein CSOJ01_15000 [Colletotrichum sojae]|uniref:SMP-30/Gluconolactonase/LRE-like region domain-containing protein n=1 Tax=Colletotrichum sojae TaxID=2175907 RepID=A0A8H6IP12_9PEZI|nr:hypothetical protein CSOJ01_15000 [Colletotrichum sojae]